jgi:Tfp pilus assembly protein PilZ
MFVHSTRIPGTGPNLRLTVNLPEGRKLVLTGRVVRSSADDSRSKRSPGFGLRLSEDSPDYASLLSRLRRKPE